MQKKKNIWVLYCGPLNGCVSAVSPHILIVLSVLAFISAVSGHIALFEPMHVWFVNGDSFEKLELSWQYNIYRPIFWSTLSIVIYNLRFYLLLKHPNSIKSGDHHLKNTWFLRVFFSQERRNGMGHLDWYLGCVTSNLTHICSKTCHLWSCCKLLCSTNEHGPKLQVHWMIALYLRIFIKQKRGYSADIRFTFSLIIHLVSSKYSPNKLLGCHAGVTLGFCMSMMSPTLEGTHTWFPCVQNTVTDKGLGSWFLNIVNLKWPGSNGQMLLFSFFPLPSLKKIRKC